MNIKPISPLIASINTPSITSPHSRPSSTTDQILQDDFEMTAFSKILSSVGEEGFRLYQSLITQSNPDGTKLEDFMTRLARTGASPENQLGILRLLNNSRESVGETAPSAILSFMSSRPVNGDIPYLDALDNVFKLGNRDLSGIFNSASEMNDEDFNTFLKSLATLLQRGVVGTRVVDWRGNPTEIFIENEIGSDYSHAKPWRNRSLP